MVASVAMVTALSGHPAASALVSQPITCATNFDISQSGCGNGPGSGGASGFGNVTSPGASGAGQVDSAGASGTGNLRSPGASGSGHVDSPGASGCNNVSSAGASGQGHVNSPGASGGPSCSGSTPPPTTPPVTSPPGGVTTTIPNAEPPTTVTAPILPVTGRNSTAPLTLALGLMLTGAAAVGLTNRRRHALAVATGGELLPLSAAVGLLLTGRAKVTERDDPARS